MEIIEAYMTKNPSYTSNRKITPIGILVHSTGAVNRELRRYVDSPERLGKNQYNNHWNKDTANKSVHAFIGYDKDKQVIVAETLPPDRACWGCGKGSKGSYNRDQVAHLQFEICQGSDTDSTYYWQAIQVAAEYCAYLCRKYGWTEKNITSHYEAHAAGYASNHGDPRSWMIKFGDSMDQFRQMVAELLNGEEPTPTPGPAPEPDPEPTPTPEPEVKTVTIEMNVLKKGAKGEQVKTLQRLLNSLGRDCGNVDGSFGPATDSAVRIYQKAEGLEVDGSVGKNTWTALLK